jgi:hypothetical protein
MSELDYAARKKIVSGYDLLVGEIIENDDAELHYVSFMFHQLSGNRRAQIGQMVADVTRFHGILKNHVVRRPDAAAWNELVPVLIGLPDWPVCKKKKEPIRNLQVNDGLHFNAVVLMPPTLEGPHIKGVKESRLEVTLDLHVKENEQKYMTEKLYRIHVTPTSSQGTIVNYTFKSFLSGQTSIDDILILK